MVFPFVKALKQWISANSPKQQNNKTNEAIGTTLTSSSTYPLLPISKKSPSNQQLNKDEQRKLKQVQHFNKLNKDEYDDLVNCKDNLKKNQKITAFTSNSSNNSGPIMLTNSHNISTHTNSRFKPVKQIKQQVTQVQATNTPGVLTITATTTSGGRSKSSSSTSKSVDLTLRNQQQLQQEGINNKVKKQLDFYGPECWLNFKFNYEQLLSDLPAIVL
jgi:hypothetical protein